MLQQPNTETDQLANVIQVLQLGKKTGVLVVERDTGSNIERGRLMLADGRITHVSAGQRRGQEALAWLQQWGPCRFSFSLEQNASYPSQAHYTSALLPQGSERDTGPGPAFETQLPITTPKTRPLQQPTWTGSLSNSRTISNSWSHPSNAWATTPFRTRHIEGGLHVIEHMGFSRAHRRLFLLIDGRRTLQDLARLLAYEPTQVYHLLKELERAGVIQA